MGLLRRAFRVTVLVIDGLVCNRIRSILKLLFPGWELLGLCLMVTHFLWDDWPGCVANQSIEKERVKVLVVLDIEMHIFFKKIDSYIPPSVDSILHTKRTMISPQCND